MTQADRLVLKVGSNLALCCIHLMNRGNPGNAAVSYVTLRYYVSYSDDLRYLHV